MRYSSTGTGDAEHRGKKEIKALQVCSICLHGGDSEEEQLLKNRAVGPNESPEDERHRPWLLGRSQAAGLCMSLKGKISREGGKDRVQSGSQSQKYYMERQERAQSRQWVAPEAAET